MNNLPTTRGFRIGGEFCCPVDYFNGWIRVSVPGLCFIIQKNILLNIGILTILVKRNSFSVKKQNKKQSKIKEIYMLSANIL